MKKEKIKVYIYTRVSTAMQIDGYSLDAQKSRMKAFADFNDYEIVGEYEDAGKSGKSIEGRIQFNQMMEDIKSGKSVEREPVYSQTANSHGENDYGNSYVEINLTSQHLFVYKNGSLVVDSDFVSGNLSKGHGSPTGAFSVTYTTTDAVLRGEDYATPVKYWMPFNGNVGIHDADTWRSEYGGEIYKTSGSHGCVNTPTANAEKIFNTVEIGTPVIVY